MYFFKKHKNRMIVALVTIILIIIMGFTSQEREEISMVENTVGNFLVPINKIGFRLRKNITNIFDVVRNLSSILDENENLKIELAELKEENRELENVIGKYDYLKNEAKLQKQTKYKMLSAEVVSKESGNWYDRFIIDKGSNDNIKKGDTVILGIETSKGVIKEGLVGRVADVGSDWAKIVSVIDELNKVSFKTIRTQDGGVLSGSVGNKLEGFSFDKDADIVVGDKIYTSGMGNKFEKDIYIGEISEVIEDEEELVKRVVIEPGVDFKKIYQVFIILD